MIRGMKVYVARNRMLIPAILFALSLFCPRHVFAEVEEDGHKPCSLCHQMKGDKAQGVKIKPDTKTINPYTGKPYGPVDGVCIRCHSDLIHVNQGHVLGVRPDKVKVPDEYMGYKGQEGELTCLACHNPHPKETKYKFLRWQTSKADVDKLCGRCHTDEMSYERFPKK